MTRHCFTRRGDPRSGSTAGLARRRLGPRGRAEEVVAALSERIEEVAGELGLDSHESEDLTAAAEVVARWLVVRGETGSALDTNVHRDEEDLYVRAAIRSAITEIVLPEQVARLAPLLRSGADSFQIAIDDSVLVAVLQRSVQQTSTEAELEPTAARDALAGPLRPSRPSGQSDLPSASRRRS